ncbi:hypothetical protein [Actinoallomurus sp. CA-150999]|uniref:hypothetical protein n=1 Tax=Actinoallomurus sp. CA-150999 TaxID=3239887 RepID=UPI003D8B00F2
MNTPDTAGLTAWRWLAVFCPPEFAALVGQYDAAIAARAMAAHIDQRDDGTVPQRTTRRRRMFAPRGGVSWSRRRRIGGVTENRAA